MRVVAENFLASVVSQSGLHLLRLSCLSPILLKTETQFTQLEKSTMKRFCTTFRTTLQQKRNLGLVILGILGLVGGSSLVVQLPPSTYTATGCSMNIKNFNAGSGDIGSLIGETYGSSMQAIVQVNHILNDHKIFPGRRGVSLSASCIPASNMSARTERTNINQSAVAAMINRVFGPYSPGAMHVAMCESGLNPNAYNQISIGDSHAVGVFQILYPSTWMRTPEAASSPYDAMANVLAAYSIFARDGYSWREWTCRP